MNRLKLLILLFCTLISMSSFSQEKVMPLLITGFDSISEQNEWKQYRLGASGMYDWGYSSCVYASPYYALYHDYQVGVITNDTVKDWYVSPPFDLRNGATLSLKINGTSLMFDTLGEPTLTSTDYFGIWYGPDTAPNYSCFKELINLSDFALNVGFKDTSGIVLPPVDDDSCHIAFVFHNQSSWYTIAIDDVVVARKPVNITYPKQAIQMRVSPNPFTHQANVSIDPEWGIGCELRLYSMQGQLVVSEILSNNNFQLNRAGLRSGMYLLTVVRDNQMIKPIKVLVQ